MMLQNILINLNILSKIKTYDKIYMNNDNLITIEYNTILQGIFRFIYKNDPLFGNYKCVAVWMVGCPVFFEMAKLIIKILDFETGFY